jgi:hypothetical protein
VGRELQIDLVDSDQELRALVLAFKHGSARPAAADSALPEAYSWDGVARRLLELIDGAEPAPATGPPVPTGSLP